MLLTVPLYIENDPALAESPPGTRLPLDRVFPYRDIHLMRRALPAQGWHEVLMVGSYGDIQIVFFRSVADDAAVVEALADALGDVHVTDALREIGATIDVFIKVEGDDPAEALAGGADARPTLGQRLSERLDGLLYSRGGEGEMVRLLRLRAMFMRDEDRVAPTIAETLFA